MFGHLKVSRNDIYYHNTETERGKPCVLLHIDGGGKLRRCVGLRSHSTPFARVKYAHVLSKLFENTAIVARTTSVNAVRGQTIYVSQFECRVGKLQRFSLTAMSFYQKRRNVYGVVFAALDFEATLAGGKPKIVANASVYNSLEAVHIRERWRIRR